MNLLYFQHSIVVHDCCISAATLYCPREVQVKWNTDFWLFVSLEQKRA